MSNTVENTTLPELLKEFKIGKESMDLIIKNFDEYLPQIAELESEAHDIVVSDESQKKEMKEAKAMRLKLRKLRTDSDKKRKDLKADALAYGKAVQAIYNKIEGRIKPLEEHLQNQEDFIKIKELERINALREDRQKQLEPYSEYMSHVTSDIGVMSDDEFEMFLNGAKFKKSEAEKKVETDKLHESRKKDITELWSHLTDEERARNFGVLSLDEWSSLVSKAEKAKDKFINEEVAKRQSEQKDIASSKPFVSKLDQVNIVEHPTGAPIPSTGFHYTQDKIGGPVTLEDCPIGLFLSEGDVCFKTAYLNMIDKPEAYILNSGKLYKREGLVVPLILQTK